MVGGGEEDGKSLTRTSAGPAQLFIPQTEQSPERQSSWNVEFIPACLLAMPPLRAHTFGPLSFLWSRVPTVTERVSQSQGLRQWLPRKETSTSCRTELSEAALQVQTQEHLEVGRRVTSEELSCTLWSPTPRSWRFWRRLRAKSTHVTMSYGRVGWRGRSLSRPQIASSRW